MILLINSVVLDFIPGFGRSGIWSFLANPALAKFLTISGFGGFQHNCRACEPFEAESNKCSIG